MPYLIQNDFLKQIQPGNLSAVIGSNYTIINSWLLAAQEKASSYLKQKYDIAKEFTETTAWIYASSYKAADRVYLDAVAYNETLTYTLNSLTLQTGNIYQCSTAITLAEAFNIAHWTLLGPQYTIYYAKFPKPVFDVYGAFNVGDQVFWNNNIYTAKQSTQMINDAYALQYGSYSNIPLPNSFPDAPGQTQWTLTTTGYNVPANTGISNTTYWTLGDNRGQQMVQILINLVLYYAHGRISPMNVPDHIKANYRESVDWLKDACDGMITPNLVKLQPAKGNRIRFGGDVRMNLRY